MLKEQTKDFNEPYLIMTENVFKEDCLFSYAVKKVSSTITLYQKETGFTLSLEIEKIDDTLRVTRFMLTNNILVEAVSKDLNDAADIEITLQALAYLFVYAKRYEMAEIMFILPQAQAIQISCFEGLFEEASPVFLEGQRRVSLTLSCVLQDYFLEQINALKSRIYHELWMRQREDRALKHYLQNRHKEDFSFFQSNILPGPLSTQRYTIIPLPVKTQKR